MQTRPGRVEPEICLRIVHTAGDGNHRSLSATYREQAVEIVLVRKPAPSGNTNIIRQMTPAVIQTWPLPSRTPADGIGAGPASAQ